MSLNQQEQQNWKKVWTTGDEAWFEKTDFIRDVFDTFFTTHGLKFPYLDVGCGRGAFMDYVSERTGRFVIGTDLFVEPFDMGRQQNVQADCVALPFKSACFNTITSILMIEHVPDWRLFLKEAHRILTPGGNLCLLFPNYLSLVTPVLFVKYNLVDHRTMPYHRPLTKRCVVNALNQLEFNIVDVKYLSIMPYKSRISKKFGKFLNPLVPEQFKEEILIIAEKRKR